MTANGAPSGAGAEQSESPESALRVAELLANASVQRNPVRIVGGGGAAALGNSLRPVGWSLSTSRLNRFLTYEPTDMTLSVESGARLADVAAVLAERGQMLPVEATDPARATIGGLLATGLTGPRRYGGGSLRDVLIGIAVAYPDGTVGKAGGLVVKNVSGFDMMRVHSGAMGTLGVIISANFKLLPLPRSEFTARATFRDMEAALAAAARLRAPNLRPVALVVLQLGDGWELAARYEGRESGLRVVRSRLADIVGLDSSSPEGRESTAFWAGIMAGRAMTRATEVRLRVAVTPGALASTARQVLETAGADHVVSRFEVEPGLGMITISIDCPSESREEPAVSLVRTLRERVLGSVVTVMTAPDGVKAGLDVWGKEPETIEIMRRLKREFDPDGILNPGIFVAAI